jgi:hypothetical protein
MIDEAGARLTLVHWRGFDKYSVVFEKDDSDEWGGISSGVFPERPRARGQRIVFRDYQPTIPPAVMCGITGLMKDVENVSALLDSLARKWQGDTLLPQPARERRMRSLRNRASSRVSDKKRASSEEKARFTLYPYCAKPPKSS